MPNKARKTAYVPRRRKNLLLEAMKERGRKQTERARIDVMTTPGYKRRPAAPLTPAQIRSQKAAALRGRLTEGITPIERLDEALRGKVRKKD